MAAMDTKEIFDLYFKDIPSESSRRIRPQVDRPEVYAYEIKVGKQIFDMDVDELLGLILSFNNERRFGDSNFSISYGSIDQIASTYRSIWNYYIDNIEIIRNPWNDKRMRGAALAKRLSESKEPFTYDVIDTAITNLYNEHPDDNYTPKYIECLLLLFYNGFAEAQEIVLLKEDMINFKTHEVRLTGRTVHLSDRCFELLQYVHNLDEIDTQRGTYKAVPYHDGYFKFVVRAKDADAFQAKTLTEAGAVLTRKITMCVRKKYGIDINYRIVYLLGFFDYIVSKTSLERAKELVTSVRSSEDAQELMRYAGEYGVVADNVTYIKKCLRPFI